MSSGEDEKNYIYVYIYSFYFEIITNLQKSSKYSTKNIFMNHLASTLLQTPKCAYVQTGISST